MLFVGVAVTVIVLGVVFEVVLRLYTDIQHYRKGE